VNSNLDLGQPACYQICVQGCLEDRWAGWFEGMRLARDANGHTTTLVGTVPDQAALHGLLARIRDLGLPLLSLMRITGDERAPVEPPDNTVKGEQPERLGARQ
jgi:hypothetical protein